MWFGGLGSFVTLLDATGRDDRVLFSDTGKDISVLPSLMFSSPDLLKRWKAVKEGGA